MRHAIIADDLTGAMDVAAVFANHGFTAAVATGEARIASSRADILIVCTHSRQSQPDEAVKAVRVLCRQLRQARRKIVYKKIDSTFQGNVVAEAEAIRKAGGFAAMLISPAHPIHGRVVHKSILRARGGLRLDLAAHFRRGGMENFEAIHSPLSVRAIARAIARAGQSPHRLCLADARTERDLSALVRAAAGQARSVLLAGSAGLAAALARSMRKSERRPQASGSRSSRVTHFESSAGVLVLAGSDNPATQRQIQRLAAEAGTKPFDLDRLTAPVGAAALARTGCLIVRVPVHRTADKILLRQFRALAPLFRRRLVGNLILTGGDTAALACRWLRPRSIEVLGEIEPGLAWGRFEGGRAAGLPLCTKPGGFGRPSSLIRATAFLCG